jgi:hypothetical protein
MDKKQLIKGRNQMSEEWGGVAARLQSGMQLGTHT